MCWVVPVLLFGVSRLFVASQRAKSSELQPCWGFSAHQPLSSVGWLCEDMGSGVDHREKLSSIKRELEETGLSAQALLQSCQVGFEL